MSTHGLKRELEYNHNSPPEFATPDYTTDLQETKVIEEYQLEIDQSQYSDGNEETDAVQPHEENLPVKQEAGDLIYL